MNSMLNLKDAQKSLSKAEKVAQFFMPAAFINDSEEEIQRLERLIETHHIGGICFFHSRASAATNYEGKKEVIFNEESLHTLKKRIHRFQATAKYPLFISIDAEWGLAMRIENTRQYPYAITLGAIQDEEELLFQVGRNIGRDCREAGIHWNFAPVADINNNPKNPVIGYRSFGSNASNVKKKATLFMKGLQSEGILTSAKHFPGHGDTATDSHLGLPVIDKSKESLLRNELLPFIGLIDEGVDSVMIGHLAIPSLTEGNLVPATLSQKIIKDLLREELQFKGVVVSDAMNMHAVSKMYTNPGQLSWEAFDAGIDILCFAEHVEAGIHYILENAHESAINTGFERVWTLKYKALKTESDALREDLIPAENLNKKLAQASLTLHKGTKEMLVNFRNTDFAGIEISQENNGLFLTEISKLLEIKTYTISGKDQDLEVTKLTSQKNILLAIYPPNIKPHQNFGFNASIIRQINNFLTHHNVILYVFGNPYFLNCIKQEQAQAIVIAYQNFEVFQENAVAHFLGKAEAQGKLSVAL